VDITAASDAGPFYGLTFNGNICYSTVTMTTTSDSDSVFNYGTFIGNIFYDQVLFGTTGLLNEFSNIIINANTGTGSIIFRSDKNSGNFALHNVTITCNVMSGNLQIGDVGTTDRNFHPSANNQIMIALNRFASYVNIDATASDALYLGWGDTDGSPIIASNRIISEGGV
jgi:hypothetical protein